MPVVLALLATAGASAANITLPVPNVTIYPGDIIVDELLVMRAFQRRRLGRMPVLDKRKLLVGKVARRTLLPGRPILVNAVRAPFAVRQGKTALVLYRVGALSISSHAVALQSGRPGDIISLRNIDSGLVFKGAVAADGTITIGTP